MGQFLPNIRNVFEEIKKYKKELEEIIKAEGIEEISEIAKIKYNPVSAKEAYK